MLIIIFHFLNYKLVYQLNHSTDIVEWFIFLQNTSSCSLIKNYVEMIRTIVSTYKWVWVNILLFDTSMAQGQ